MPEKKSYVWTSGHIKAAKDGGKPGASRPCIYCLRLTDDFRRQSILPAVLDREGLSIDGSVCVDCAGLLHEIDARLEKLLSGLSLSDASTGTIDLKWFREDPLALRAISKIAFHYLAMKHGADAALEERFHPVRQYIREGRGDGRWVKLADHSPRMPFIKLERSHLVSLVNTKEELIGFGSLFGSLDFGVHLGPDTSSDELIPQLTYWNYDTGRVIDVAAQDLALYFAPAKKT